jgi:hypothetical protein
MKVKKIPCRDLHVGMTIVDGTKENHRCLKVTEVHLKPRDNEGSFKVEGRSVGVPFKMSEAFIRVVNDG